MQFGVGTPLWKKPTEAQPILPSGSTSLHSIFCGVVLFDGEESTGPVRVLTQGDLPARVRGTVAAGDSLGFSAGNDYLVSGGTPSVAEALAAVPADTTKVIMARFGGGGGGEGRPIWRP